MSPSATRPLSDHLKARLAAFHYELADLMAEARARDDIIALRQVAVVQGALANAEIQGPDRPASSQPQDNPRREEAAPCLDQ